LPAPLPALLSSSTLEQGEYPVSNLGAHQHGRSARPRSVEEVPQLQVEGLTEVFQLLYWVWIYDDDVDA